MRKLYEVIIEAVNQGTRQTQIDEPKIRVFNLSYDICSNGAKNELENETFIPYLYENEIISTDVEFVVVDNLTQIVPDDAEKYYVIRPAESTIIFGSFKSGNNIIAKLNEHPELHFAIVELPNQRNTIRTMVINHIEDGANEQIKKEIDKKEKDKQEKEQNMIFKRFKTNAGMKDQPKCMVKIVKICK